MRSLFDDDWGGTATMTAPAPAREARPAPKPATDDEARAAEEFAAELRENALAIELNLQKVGRSRALDARHREEVADHFQANRRAVGSSKRLYAPDQREIKAIATALGEARAAWLSMTIAYRKGVRLLQKSQLAQWEKTFNQCRARLDAALAEADAHYTEIIDASREFLGRELFDASDYPASFAGSIRISWQTFNFEPSEELLRLAPATYAREQARVRAQFEAAVATFEEETRDQLAKLVDSLLGKLNDAENGKRVVYTEAATSNLREFFNRFETLNIRSNADLSKLIDDARDALGGVNMADLKRSRAARRDVAARFTEVRDQLSQLITAAPVRSIDVTDLD